MVQHNEVVHQVVVRDTVERYKGTSPLAYRSHVFF